MKDEYRWLWELRDLSPVNRYSVSDEIHVLIPIFTCAHYNTHKHLDIPLGEHRIDAFAKSALWSWYTWREYSDAKNYGVQVSIYLEESLVPRLASLFTQNGLMWDTDVITFSVNADEPPESWSRLGKQMYPYWDSRFADCKWLIVSDSDFFIPQTGFKFFNRMDTLPDKYKQQIGFCRIRRGKESEMFHRSGSNFIGGVQGKTPLGMSVDEALIELLGRDVSEIITKETVLQHPYCCLWTYPARWFYSDYDRGNDFRNFCYRAARLIGSDQLSAVLWDQLFPNMMFSIEELFDIHVYGVWDLRLSKNEKFKMLHGRARDKNSYKRLKELLGL